MHAGLSFSLAAGLIVLTGCAPTEGSESLRAARAAGQCFRAAEVNGFNPVDQDSVDVTIRANRVYRLELFGPCHDINWSHRIAIRSRGSSYICSGTGMDAELIVPGAIGPNRCRVSSVRRLGEAEIEAARRRD